jgi:hypothetical protein
MLFPVCIKLYTWKVSFFAPETPLLISFSGGHHWDENGLRDGEIHNEMIEFVRLWLKGREVPSVTKFYNRPAIV